MIEVNNVTILANVLDIMEELQFELIARGIDKLNKVKVSGRNVMVTCPVHAEGQERRPSCGITAERVVDYTGVTPAGTAHCFTCGYSAGLAEFISTCFGKNDGGISGFKWLVENFHNLEYEGKRDTKLSFGRGEEKKEVVHYVTEDELEKYRFYHDYMWRRKLNEKVVDYFDIGYDKETDCITFPVSDKKGNVLFVQRRSINTKFFQFQESDKKGQTLFGIHQVYKNIDKVKSLWVVESPICALSCWVNKQPAVATMGALPTHIHLKLLKELPVREIVLAQDNDEAGNLGRQKCIKILRNSKSLYVPLWPEGIKDINQIAMELDVNPMEFLDITDI